LRGTPGLIEPPVISTTLLNRACLGEVYAVDLVATDSNAGELHWSGTLPSGIGLTLSPQGRLSGILKRTGHFLLNVQIQNQKTGCTSSEKTLELEISGKEAEACPTVIVAEMPAEAPAPAACASWPYNAKFAVIGGEPSFTWSAVGLPSEFSFDSLSQELTGNPTAAASVTLQVTDGKGRTVQRDFDIPLRQKCWFGYVSEDGNATSLHLLDPQLKAQLQRPATVSAGTVVEDFKFSPRGRFIAYRFKDSGGVSRLSLWQGPKWDREQELPFEGSVTQYEWSDFEDVLAVAFTSNTGDTQLGGVNVTAVPAVSPPGTIQGLSMLTPIVADVDSELTWYGDAQNRSVAFGSPWRTAFRIGSHATLSADGFASVITASTVPYSATMTIYPGSDGYFGAETDSDFLNYHRNGTSFIATHDNEAVAPSGRYTAYVNDDTLELRHADDSILYDPMITAGGCANLLAWAKDQERLVCAGTDPMLLWSHTLALSQTSFDSVAIGGGEEYLQADWRDFKRAMSRSGNWLALSTADRLYVANLASANPQISWSSALASDQQGTSLSFAPDETLMVTQRGANLWLFGVRGQNGPGGMWLGSTYANPDQCSEDSLPSPSWCGSDRGRLGLKWAPESQFVAWVSDTGALQIADLRIWHAYRWLAVDTIEPACDQQCVGTFQFQP
jgi:hypothetical protein